MDKLTGNQMCWTNLVYELGISQNAHTIVTRNTQFMIIEYILFDDSTAHFRSISKQRSTSKQEFAWRVPELILLFSKLQNCNILEKGKPIRSRSCNITNPIVKSSNSSSNCLNQFVRKNSFNGPFSSVLPPLLLPLANRHSEMRSSLELVASKLWQMHLSSILGQKSLDNSYSESESQSSE